MSELHPPELSLCNQALHNLGIRRKSDFLCSFKLIAFIAVLLWCAKADRWNFFLIEESTFTPMHRLFPPFYTAIFKRFCSQLLAEVVLEGFAFAWSFEMWMNCCRDRCNFYGACLFPFLHRFGGLSEFIEQQNGPKQRKKTSEFRQSPTVSSPSAVDICFFLTWLMGVWHVWF